jgi:hypothetical protein
MKSRRRTIWLVAVSSVIAVVVAAPAMAGRSGRPKPLSPLVVSAAEGGQVVAEYSTKNNAANTTRDAAVIGAIEANPLREVSLAGFQIERGLKERPGKPFGFQAVTTYAGRMTDWPRWFISSSRVNGDADAGDLSVFTRDAVAERWRKALDVGVGAQTIAPTVKDGATQPPDARATAQVNAALAALMKYLQTGVADPASRVGKTNASEWSAFVVEERKGAGRGGSVTVRCAPGVIGPPYAVRAAGGHLVLGLVVCRLKVTAEPHRTFTLSGDWGALAPDVDERKTVTATYDHQLALIVRTDGSTTVLGDSVDLVAAH